MLPQFASLGEAPVLTATSENGDGRTPTYHEGNIGKCTHTLAGPTPPVTGDLGLLLPILKYLLLLDLSCVVGGWFRPVVLGYADSYW